MKKFEFRNSLRVFIDGNLVSLFKSKLLLPGTPEEEFKVQEVAEKLKYN